MSEPIISFDGEYRWLSNFYDHIVDLGGRMFASAEHAYQATKTFDEDEQRTVQLCRSPGSAKRAGQAVTLRPDWDTARVPMMRLVVDAKFPIKGGRRSSLVQKLLETGERVLVEGNNWRDQFWGATWQPLWALQPGQRSAAWAERTYENNTTDFLVGRNQLGVLLMERRDELREAGL